MSFFRKVMRPCLGQAALLEAGTSLGGAVQPHGHSWVPRATASTSGRGMDALAVGQHRLRAALGCWGEVGPADSASSSHLELHFQRSPGLSSLSHPIPAAGSSTWCHPGLLHRSWERSCPRALLCPSTSFSAKMIPTAAMGQGHEDMRMQGQEDKALQLPAIPACPDVPGWIQRCCHTGAPSTALINPLWPSQANPLTSFATSVTPKGLPAPKSKARGAV